MELSFTPTQISWAEICKSILLRSSLTESSRGQIYVVPVIACSEQLPARSSGWQRVPRWWNKIGLSCILKKNDQKSYRTRNKLNCNSLFWHKMEQHTLYEAQWSIWLKQKPVQLSIIFFVSVIHVLLGTSKPIYLLHLQCMMRDWGALYITSSLFLELHILYSLKQKPFQGKDKVFMRIHKSWKNWWEQPFYQAQQAPYIQVFWMWGSFQNAMPGSGLSKVGFKGRIWCKHSKKCCLESYELFGYSAHSCCRLSCY